MCLSMMKTNGLTETNDIGEGSKKRQISYDSDPDPGSDFEPSPRKRTKTHGKQENSKANGLVKKLTSKSARLEKEIERLGDALTETQETLETFRETNNDLEERIARAARKKLAAKAAREQEKEKDSRDKDLLASEKKEISAANTLLSQERDSLRKSLDTSNNALMEIASRNVALIDQNKRLVDAESVSKSAQADLQMQVLRHTHENEELRRMLQERDAESAVQGEPLPVAVLAQLPGPIRQVVEYLNQQNSIAGNMRTEVAEGKQKLADAEERLETKTMEVLRAKAETASAQRDLADATKRLVDSEDNFKKATETAQNCQKQLHALNDALITVNHELAESKRKLEDAEGQVAANQKDVMELTAARQELSLKYDKEVERRLEAERRISDLQKAVREVPNMLQSLLG
ncbi:hypothetical protein PLICRDRAFT_450596 [Plicaturopsis crispa FD-325 SS-3]|uniref:Uncharacterized protein n=1 Tax=Plicaturopsis crispa FD-325 SS-3 TaxID=944288 RepID=A0A0C9SK94_PLICR|nr:hypothetical protein PLICRDRAFT_450596 [Plicaturopsis crispa FD-325 SS-3]